MKDFVIRLENITKVYHMGTSLIKALDDISVSLEYGSFWAIMGKSGSGKSTMLNLLGCLDKPSSGHYILNGRNVADLDDEELSDIRLANIGFVFQSFNLIPQLTVQENIELPGFYIGHNEKENSERAKYLAEKVKLSDRLNHLPSELSGGQQQRVAIARALINDPPVILADEPTGNLDTETGDQIMDLLGHLNQQGKTVIIVTHEDDIAHYARHRLYLQDGKRLETL